MCLSYLGASGKVGEARRAAGAFGLLLGLELVNQACPANEARAKGTLGTKLTAVLTARGGGLRSKP